MNRADKISNKNNYSGNNVIIFLSWHIQNPGIFKALGIFKTLSNI